MLYGLYLFVCKDIMDFGFCYLFVMYGGICMIIYVGGICVC